MKTKNNEPGKSIFNAKDCFIVTDCATNSSFCAVPVNDSALLVIGGYSSDGPLERIAP